MKPPHCGRSKAPQALFCLSSLPAAMMDLSELILAQQYTSWYIV